MKLGSLYKMAKILKSPPKEDSSVKIVVMAIFDQKGKILLVRRPESEEHRPLDWEMPGGHREPGETIEEAGLREIREEIGLLVTIEPTQRIYFSHPEGYGVVLKAKPVTRKIRLLLEEHDKYVWLDPSEAKKVRPCPPDMPQELDIFMKTACKPEKVLEDLGSVFETGSPSWEAAWKLSNMKKPDWDLSDQQAPMATELVVGKNENDEVYKTLVEALKEDGYFERCQCSKGKKSATLYFDDHTTQARVAKLLKRRNFAVTKENLSTLKIALGTEPPVTLTLSPEQLDPTEKLQKTLGPGAEVEKGTDGSLTIQTDDPTQDLQKTQELFQMAASKLKRKAALRRRGFPERKEYSPEEYGKVLDDQVNNEDQYIMDLAMETQHMGPDEAWQIVKTKLKEAFPAFNIDDMRYMKNRWQYVRERL